MCWLTTVALPLVAQNVTVDAKIEPTDIRIGEQATLQLDVTIDQGQTAIMPAWPDTLVRGIEVLEAAKTDTAYLNNKERVHLTQRYVITSFDSALYYIPAIEVLVDGKAYSSSGSLALKVESVPVDVDKPDEFFGPKDIMRVPLTWADWRGILFAFLLLLLCSTALYYLIIRLKDNQPIIRRIKVEPKVPPHVQALNEIERVKADKIAQKGEPKVYYTELTDIIRRYISDRFGVSALEMTSDEIIQRLTKGCAPEELRELRFLFQTADLVKFAKHYPMLNENDANLLHAISFINDTKEVEDPQKKAEPTEITVVEKRPLRMKIILITGIVLLSAAAIGAVVYAVMRVYYLI